MEGHSSEGVTAMSDGFNTRIIFGLGAVAGQKPSRILEVLHPQVATSRSQDSTRAFNEIDCAR